MRRVALPLLCAAVLAGCASPGLTRMRDDIARSVPEAEIGRGLYPRAPDMRAGATQNLTDGELFSIIENGIRLTGMPAWGTGTAEGVRASWALVHFIRRLPTLTDEEIDRMEALNPKTAEQWRQEEEARRFLAGDDPTPPPVSTHKHDGSQP